MNKILIVEDDKSLRDELYKYLKNRNYNVLAIEKFDNLLEDILKENPDLVLLDINLPYNDGFFICEKLKELSQIEVMIITSRDHDMDELLGLKLGARDFIRKPFNSQILLARIDNILEKDRVLNEISYKGLTLDLLKGQIIHKGKSLDLSKTEIEILYILMKNGENISSRIEIIEALWTREDFIEDSTLTVNINRLRKKLEEVGLENYIKTKRGMGYSL